MGSIKVKFLGLLVIGMFCIFPSYGQNWNEIFRQKKTQQKYLLQQIAALEVYAGYLKKGYEIAKDGLQTIGDFADGEFSLHNVFIKGLKKVNPVIGNDIRVIKVMEMQLKVNGLFKQVNRKVNDVTGRFDEVNGIGALTDLGAYVTSVRVVVMEECDSDLEELLLVVTAGKLEMRDEERMERLNKIYFSMRDKVAFTQGFCNEIQLFLAQKEIEIKSIDQLKQIYGNW